MNPPAPEPISHAPHSLSDLFWSLNALALQGFGGVIAAAQRVLVVQKRWYTDAQFVEAWAVAQVLPGPNIINLCAELGARHFGVRGLLVAIAGLLTVPFLLTIGLVALYSEFANIAWVAGAVRGMAAVSAGLVIAAGLRLGSSLKDHVLGRAVAVAWVLIGFFLVGVLRWNLSAVLLGLGLCACCMTWRALKRQGQQKRQKSQSTDD